MYRTLVSASTLVLLSLVTAAGEEKSASNTLTAAEGKAGWKLLFDGKTLAGWRRYNHKDATGWAVKDGAIYLEKPGSGDLMTEAKYGDFELSLDWKFEKGNNSGIIYRVVEGRGPSHNSGPEMQVMMHRPTDKLGKHSGGSLYDMYAPTSNPFRGPGEWTNFRIVCKGKHIEHWVNGIQVVACTIGSADWQKRYQASKWKKLEQFAAAAQGHIALQDHGGRLYYRNIKIRLLDGK